MHTIATYLQRESPSIYDRLLLPRTDATGSSLLSVFDVFYLQQHLPLANRLRWKRLFHRLD